jgi:hypothetical protein
VVVAVAALKAHCKLTASVRQACARAEQKDAALRERQEEARKACEALAAARRELHAERLQRVQAQAALEALRRDVAARSDAAAAVQAHAQHASTFMERLRIEVVPDARFQPATPAGALAQSRTARA